MPAARKTHIATAYPDRVEVRGRDLTGDLMGRLTFTEYFHLLLTGASRPRTQRFFLDLLLVAIAEHGLMPSNVAARMTLAADPESLQGAVAAGILGAGSVVLGASEECARLLERGGDPSRGRARDPRRGRQACPASAIRCTRPSTRARSGSSSSPTSAASAARTSRSRARCETRSPRSGGGRSSMNVAMPIAAVWLDLGYPASTVKAVPILARTASLLAHLAEERERADRLRARARRRGGGRVRVMLDPEVETRPWDEQLALDDASFPRAARVPARALAVLPREARAATTTSASPRSRSCR